MTKIQTTPGFLSCWLLLSLLPAVEALWQKFTCHIIYSKIYFSIHSSEATCTCCIKAYIVQEIVTASFPLFFGYCDASFALLTSPYRPCRGSARSRGRSIYGPWPSSFPAGVVGVCGRSGCPRERRDEGRCPERYCPCGRAAGWRPVGRKAAPVRRAPLTFIAGLLERRSLQFFSNCQVFLLFYKK